MENFYFTFGCGIDDPHRNCYTVIEAESWEDAREDMIRRFGIKWAFQYAEKNWFIDPKKDREFRRKALYFGFDPNRTEPVSQAELYQLKKI